MCVRSKNCVENHFLWCSHWSMFLVLWGQPLSHVISDKQSFISLFQVIFDLDFNCSNSQSDNLEVKVITFLTWKVLSFCSVIMKFLFVTLIDGLILEWYNDSYKPIGQKRVCSQLYPFCIVVKKKYTQENIQRNVVVFFFNMMMIRKTIGMTVVHDLWFKEFKTMQRLKYHSMGIIHKKRKKQKKIVLDRWV